MKYRESRKFSSGTEYECFKYEYCERCVHHKEREGDGFPAFIEDGGCPIEDMMEIARFSDSEYPSHYIWEVHDDDGSVRKFHHCPFCRKSE